MRRSTSSSLSCSVSVMDDHPFKAFHEIGSIAHHFESCEYLLSEIFQILCESENETPFRVLGLIVSSDLRLQMTEIALEECLRRPSALKTQIKEVFQEFRACQTLRNRAIHSAMTPTFWRYNLTWHHRPLPHQTHRYRKGILKPGLALDMQALDDASERVLLLYLRMKGVTEELDEFLAARRARRLKKAGSAL